MLERFDTRDPDKLVARVEARVMADEVLSPDADVAGVFVIIPFEDNVTVGIGPPPLLESLDALLELLMLLILALIETAAAYCHDTRNGKQLVVTS